MRATCCKARIELMHLNRQQICGSLLPCSKLYMRLVEENQDVFLLIYLFIVLGEIIFVISQCHGRITSTCVSQKRNCNLHQAKQFMPPVFKGFIGKRCRSSHGPYVPDRLKSTQLAATLHLLSVKRFTDARQPNKMLEGLVRHYWSAVFSSLP